MINTLNALSAALVILFTFSIPPAKAADPQKPIMIRPFGDSITYGLGFTTADWGPKCWNASIGQSICMPPGAAGGGYRGFMTLFSLQGDGLTFTTEGYQAGGSYYQQWITNTQNHDGYPGWTNLQLAHRAVLASFSDVTLVHSGTNDILQGIPPKAAADTFELLLRKLLDNNPRAHFYVAQIIKTKSTYEQGKYNDAIHDYNQRIQQKLIAIDSKRTSIVGMENLLVDGDYYDGVHPNGYGYQKMACTWITSIMTTTPAVCVPILAGKSTSVMDVSKENQKKMGPTAKELKDLFSADVKKPGAP